MNETIYPKEEYTTFGCQAQIGIFKSTATLTRTEVDGPFFNEDKTDLSISIAVGITDGVTTNVALGT